jgi:hypothetical protein
MMKQSALASPVRMLLLMTMTALSVPLTGGAETMTRHATSGIEEVSGDGTDRKTILRQLRKAGEVGMSVLNKIALINSALAIVISLLAIFWRRR